MAIDALDLDRGADFGVELRVAVIILVVVTIGAVHPLFHVDVHQVHRGIGPAFALLLFLVGGRRHGRS